MNRFFSRTRIPKFAMLIFFIAAIVVCFSGSVSAATLEVGPGQTYNNISSAVTAAGTNDVINVHANPTAYNENVVITKSNLTIQANPGDTVNLQTTGNTRFFSITNANYVNIQGFNFQSDNTAGSYGFYLTNAGYTSILNNNLTTYRWGIYGSGSNNNISDNNFYDVILPVSLAYTSHNTTISGNTVSNPAYTGTRFGFREDGKYNVTNWLPNLNNKYLNNVVSNVNQAIFIQQGSNFTISGNHITIKDAIGSAWAVTLSVGNAANQLNTISNNFIASDGKVNTGSRGIYLISNPSSPLNANIQIFSNNINNFDYGIYSTLYTPTGTPVTDIYLNRFYNNTRSLAVSGSPATMTINAVNNWWGKNSGLNVFNQATQPASYDIWWNTGTILYNPWIVLNVSANPVNINTGETSTITADLTLNSNDQDTTLMYPGKYVPNGIPVTFAGDSLGDVSPTSSATLNGAAETTFTAGSFGGLSHPSATVDAATVQTDVNIAGPPREPPVVTNWDPATGAVNVTPDKVIQVTFDKNIYAGPGSIELKDNNNTLIPISTSITGAVLTITPDSLLAKSLYTLYLNGGCVQDVDDTPLAATSSTFSVGPGPTVTIWDPESDAVNVSPDKVITVTFNENIIAGTNWIELKNSNGAVIPITTSINGAVLTITPDNPLAESLYNIILHTACVTDVYGNPLALINSKFSTNTPPQVTNWDPASDAVNVAADKIINVTFNENIMTGTDWIELKNSNGAVIPITTSINGAVLTITPNNLLPENRYNIILHTACVTDLYGNPLVLINSRFSAGAPPQVTNWDPASGAVNVAADKIINVTFNENIMAGTNWIELKNSNGAVVPITTSINGAVLTITPDSPLPESVYNIILHTASVTDVYGNLLALVNSKFSTNIPPQVTNWDPASNAVNVARNKVITVTFNKSIKAGTNWIELKSSNGTVIPITTNISGNLLTINHATLLAANTQYNIILHTACVSDLAGNLLALTNSKFRTGAA